MQVVAEFKKHPLPPRSNRRAASVCQKIPGRHGSRDQKRTWSGTRRPEAITTARRFYYRFGLQFWASGPAQGSSMVERILGAGWIRLHSFWGFVLLVNACNQKVLLALISKR